MTDLILPTDEQVERAARAMCEADSVDPDEIREQRWLSEASPTLKPNWKHRKNAARDLLVIILNKDKILGESEPTIASAMKAATWRDLWSKCTRDGEAYIDPRLEDREPTPRSPSPHWKNR